MSAAPDRDRGALALVLHSHMPYVEGFGTWPFGEEWLWEAIATVYLPLLDVLRDAPVTLGVTPVLCDQLETLTGAAGDRFLSFLREVRAGIHAEDAAGLERDGQLEAAAELRRAAGDYLAADRAFEALGRDLVGALGSLAAGGRPEPIASSASHAVLPLLATDAGLRLQLGTGLDAHRRRFGGPAASFWLPECAYRPGLEHELSAHGVRAFCVDQTAPLGLGSLDQLEPIETPAGPIAVPIDWQTVSLIWDLEGGYPAHPTYRDYHRRTVHDLRPWDNAGRPYRHAEAMALAREHARDFVSRAAARLDAYRSERGRPGLLCCALDTELLGHWWYEGPAFLAAVLEEADGTGLALAPLSEALERVPAVSRPLAASSWGTGKDLSTWDAPAVADIAVATRRAELRVVAEATRSRGRGESGAAGRRAAEPHPVLVRAARELLALQASDWAFLTNRALAADYPQRRLGGHLAALDAALEALKDSGPSPEPRLRNLAPELDLAPLFAPA